MRKMLDWDISAFIAILQYYLQLHSKAAELILLFAVCFYPSEPFIHDGRYNDYLFYLKKM